MTTLLRGAAVLGGARSDLRIDGPVAQTWMAHAQCFAGPPETPPAPGTRHIRTD